LSYKNRFISPIFCQKSYHLVYCRYKPSLYSMFHMYIKSNPIFVIRLLKHQAYDTVSNTFLISTIYFDSHFQFKIQYNTFKANFKGLAVLLRFRDSLDIKKAKIKKNSRLDTSFGSSNRFGLNVFGLTVLYCTCFQHKIVIKYINWLL